MIVAWCGLLTGSLYGARNAFSLYEEARQKNREPYGIQLRSYQAQVKNNLIDDILSYAEARRPAFYFPEPTIIRQFWKQDHPIFTRLEGDDAPLAVRDIVDNFLMYSGQVFFSEVYGDTGADSRDEIRNLRRNSRARVKEDDTHYYLVFTPRGEFIESNTKELGLLTLETRITRTEIDILKKGLLITRTLSEGEVKVSGKENYRKRVAAVAELEYLRKDGVNLISRVRSYNVGEDDYENLVTYFYTEKDGFYLPEKIISRQKTVKDGKERIMNVETVFSDYLVNRDFSKKAELEYRAFEEMNRELNIREKTP